MIDRLVLGCGVLGELLVDRLADRPGRLFVIDDDETVVESVREANVPATAADPTDPQTLAGIEPPDVVVIAADRTDVNRAILELATETFPRATVVAYLGGNPTPADRDHFAAVADRVIDPVSATAAAVLDRSASSDASAAIGLRSQLSGIEGRLAVVTHDNPDPDAIASAVALVEVADAFGVDADACYFGEISHQENRAMVNVLDLELHELDPGDLGAYDAFALVDHSRPGVNDQLPPEIHVAVVIDHHPPRGPVPGEFVDLRENVGSTSTILTEYLDRFGIGFKRSTATALLYGIRVDTNDFTREASATDFQAASTLWPHVDAGLLERIESPTISGDTIDTIARTIQNRIQRGSIVVAGAGHINDRDALPQAAEHLLSMAGVHTTLVFGIDGEMVYLSARSRSSEIDLGETLRDAFEQIGSAGGHAEMAGAQLEIGALATTDDGETDASTVALVEEVITDRFFEALQQRPATALSDSSLATEWLFTPDDERR